MLTFDRETMNAQLFPLDQECGLLKSKLQEANDAIAAKNDEILELRVHNCLCCYIFDDAFC